MPPLALHLLGLGAAAALRLPRPLPLAAKPSLITMPVRMLSGEGEADLSKFTVVQLKEQLRAAGLPVSGRKAELIARLGYDRTTPISRTIPAVSDTTTDAITSTATESSSARSATVPFSFPSTSDVPAFPPIEIEACKSWGAFKTRAAKVSRGISEALQGGVEEAQVTINAAKPRKGVFEVRVGDVVVITTGPEARPFPSLKALDVYQVARHAADTAKAFYFLG